MSFRLQEYGKEVFIYLTAKDPQAPRRKIEFDHESRSFVGVKYIKTMIDHLEIESICLHKNSLEARKQLKQSRMCNNSGRYKINIDFFFRQVQN